MNILHVLPELDPSQGGPPRVATRLAAGQAKLGYSVILLGHPIQNSERFREMTHKLPGFDRVRLASVPSGGLLQMLPGAARRRAVRPFVRNCSVVHIHSVWYPLNYAVAAEAQAARKPYFIQPNDMLNPWSLQQKALKKKIALMLGWRQMIERSRGLLFGHAAESKLCLESHFHAEHFVVPLGGVFREEVEPLPPKGGFYQRLPQLKGRPFAVFLSRLHFKKGLDYLAEGFAVAAKHVADLQLVVIGHDEGAQADFQQRIARHGLTDRVHLVGPMHGQAKWEAYRDAVCFCLPSRDEAYTVAVTEALAAGLPVVISSGCHFDDVAEYEAGFIVDLKSPEPLGMALARLANDPNLRDTMAKNADRLFRERLSFDQAVRQMIGIYERSCGGAEGTGVLSGCQ